MHNTKLSHGLISPPKRGCLPIFLTLTGIGIIGTAVILFAHEIANVSEPVNEAISAGLKRLLSHYEPPEDGLLSSHFVRDIGIALLVAVILGATFEIFMRRREVKEHFKQMAEIENAGLLSLLGYFVPPEISTEVQEVFYEQVMRSNLTVSYRFDPPPPDLDSADQELLLVTVTVSYDLINLTKRSHRHAIDHGFEPTLPFGGAHNKFVSVEIREGGEPEPVIGWPNGPRKEDIHLAEGPKGVTQAARVEVKLKAGKAKGPRSEDIIHVIVKHQIVRRLSDQDTWNTWLPADGLKVIAETNAALPTLDFHVEKIHPGNFGETQTINKYEWLLVRESNDKAATIEKTVGVLPFQGFTLYWFPPPKGKESPASAA